VGPTHRRRLLAGGVSRREPNPTRDFEFAWDGQRTLRTAYGTCYASAIVLNGQLVATSPFTSRYFMLKVYKCAILDVMNQPGEGLRSIKKRMTRTLIAETALQLTVEKGLDHVTSEDIAHVAFVSPRTVSNYFSCKEEAVVAASSTLPELVEQYAHSPSDAAPLQALRALVTQFFATRTHEQLEQARQRLQLTESHPMLLKFQMASYGQAERHLRAAIAERTGTQVGIDLYPSLAAGATVAALRTAFWVWATSDAPDEYLTELLSGAFDHIENGLKSASVTLPIDQGASPQPLHEHHNEVGAIQSRPATPTSADRRAAAAVVAEAVAFAREAQADSVALAVSMTDDAVATAAVKTADAAATARMDRASAAAEAAAAVADTAARAAVTTQMRADALATKLSEAAARAVAVITADTSTDGDSEAAFRALKVAATAEALAVSTAEDTAAAAAGVATAVTAAATDVAFSVSALDRAIEDEVTRVAAALQTTATTIARQVAAETHSRATDVALVARGAAAAVDTTGLNSEHTRLDPAAVPASAETLETSSLSASSESVA
jgi:MftR C-terminal domain